MAMRRLYVAAIAGVAALAAALGAGACTKSSGGGPSPASTFATNLCAQLTGCCAQAGLPSTGGTCALTVATLLQKSGAPFDPDKGNACIADVQAAQGSADFCAKPLSALAGCLSLFGDAGALLAGSDAGGAIASDGGNLGATCIGTMNGVVVTYD